ncbi:MAG: hypothetical protein ACRD4V_15130, partial [Candidatus Acidiferrales bacterium]
MRSRKPLGLALALTCALAAYVFPSQRLLAQISATPPQPSRNSAHGVQNRIPATHLTAVPAAMPLLSSTTMYRCADSGLCDSPQDQAFELARRHDLQSNDPDVVRAARAYGKGVTVEFGDPGTGMQSSTSHAVRGDRTSPNGLRAIERVILRPGLPAAELEAAVGHEGSHVADAQDFVSAISRTGRIDQSRNLTTYRTEFRAYMVTHSILASDRVRAGFGECRKDAPCHLGFGVARAQAIQTINELL